jgi:uncharacterized protein YqeY
MLEQKLDQDIKTAMLAGNKQQTTALRTLKSVLLYAKVASGKRDEPMHDDELIALFSKEAKKRQESADLYIQGGSPERAEAELAEKALIEAYLPAQLSNDELEKIIDEVIVASGANSGQQMGAVIGQVRAKVGPQADGGMIAKIVKEKLGV